MQKNLRYLSMIMMLIVVVFMFAGCGNNFTEASSVTFTSSGERRTIYSTWYLIHGSYMTTTQNEYNNAEFKSSVLAVNNVNVNTIEIYASDLFSGNIYNIKEKPYKPYNITTNDVGKYFYIYAHDLGDYNRSYYKVEIKDVGAHYLQVKVVNNTTIVVKFGVNETTYTVTSYSIT